MSLSAWCPRCREAPRGVAGEIECPVHGRRPSLLLPDEVAYDGFAEHLRAADGLPTYLPWPLSSGWWVSEFAVVTRVARRPVATLTCTSGTSTLDGPVDVFVVTEEPGVGLGARCAGLAGDDPGSDLGDGPPTAKVRIGSVAVSLWAVSTSGSLPEFDRSVFVGEAEGRWLWIVLRPASAMLLLRDEWILRDVSTVGPQLLELSFGGPRPVW